MLGTAFRRISYIPINEVKQALKESKISIEESDDIYKENLVRYYNSKLIYFLKFEQWEEFFYLYRSAKMLEHGTNEATHVLAAHGYVMAYQNVDRALEVLKNVPKSTAVELTISILMCYEELKNQGIPPNSPDWSAVAGICAVAAMGKGTGDKWKRLSQSSRTPWHLNLRPWKYPRHVIEIKEEFRFKQRGDK
jgi:hypothetical protein